MPRMKKAAELLGDIGRAHGVTSAAIMLAWLLRHPAGIVPVIGTLNSEHLVEVCRADDVVLNREEWYGLFTQAAHLEYRSVE
jgi:predicted oxidoreductase